MLDSAVQFLQRLGIQRAYLLYFQTDKYMTESLTCSIITL